MSPSTKRTKKLRPTARTNGAANGSLMIGLGSALASARVAATIVAVAPTLEARSQVSRSVRVMVLLCDPSRDRFRYLANVKSRLKLYPFFGGLPGGRKGPAHASC